MTQPELAVSGGGLAGLAARLRAGELSPREAVASYLERIERRRDLNAYISVRAEEALAEAEAPPRGPLFGAPVAVKDMIDVAGARTTAASAVGSPGTELEFAL